MTIGAIVMMALTKVTGETFMATGLVVLFAWLTNVPGSLKDRVGGMLAFALGAIALTFISGQVGLALWPNVLGITVIGLLGTLLLAKGTRAYMVGYVLICWAIYSPFLIKSTSVENCVLAIMLGTGVLIACVSWVLLLNAKVLHRERLQSQRQDQLWISSLLIRLLLE